MQRDAKIAELAELGRRAVQCDRAGKLDEAIDLYQRCIEAWDAMCFEERNSQIKAKIQAKTVEYLSRMELLKRTLESSSACTGQSRPTTSDSSIPSFSPCVPTQTDIAAFKEQLSSLIRQNQSSVSLDDVVGLDEAKESILEAVVFPRKFGPLLAGRGPPWQAILLYGPPGTGKTHLARATANAVSATFLQVSSSDLLSKWQGDSEKQIRALFELAHDRRPSVIFIDEIDALCSGRGSQDTESTRRIKTEFLVQMSKLADLAERETEHILILAATNVPWDLDDALLRRFQRRIYIDLPDKEARLRFFRLKLSKVEHRLSDADFDQLATVTSGYTACDISVVIQDALLEPIRFLQKATHFRPVDIKGQQKYIPVAGASCPWHHGCTEKADALRWDATALPLAAEDLDPRDIILQPITMSTFESVAAKTKRTVSTDLLERYQAWTRTCGLMGKTR